MTTWSASKEASMKAFVFLWVCLPISAQWLRYPTPGIPRTADGKPNLTAPVPRTPDGKPDLSGLWLVQGLYIGDIAKDIKEGTPFTPWAAEIYKHRRDTLSKEDPTGWCVVGGVP